MKELIIAIIKLSVLSLLACAYGTLSVYSETLNNFNLKIGIILTGLVGIFYSYLIIKSMLI